MTQLTSHLKAVVTADDFGVSQGVNQAILDAHKKGILTSASIRTNGAAFEEAVKIYHKALTKMGLGLHLNLTDGTPHTQIRYRSFFQYFLILLFPNKKFLKLIEQELETQFLIAKRHKLPIDHVDGQDHIQMIPGIAEIICRLCKKYNVGGIRLTREPLWDKKPNFSLFKAIVLLCLSIKTKKIFIHHGLRFPEAFYGVLHTSNMIPSVIKKCILDAQKRHLSFIELASHPGYTDIKDTIHTSDFFEVYSHLPARQIEVDALINIGVAQFVRRAGIKLISYRNFY